MANITPGARYKISMQKLAMMYKGTHIALQFLSEDGVDTCTAEITGKVLDGHMEVVIVETALAEE